MPLIALIRADLGIRIRVNPRHPCNSCSMSFASVDTLRGRIERIMV